MEWIDPFDPSTTSMPEHYSSGTTLEPKIRLEDSLVGNDPGQLEWYLKKAGEDSWSGIYSPEIKERFHHGETYSSGTAVFDANTYLLDEGDSFTLGEGESETVTIDGNDHEFSADDIRSSNNPPEVTYSIDGIAEGAYVGEYNGPVENYYIRVTDIVEPDVGDEYIELTLYDPILDEPDDSYELKAVAETDQDEYYHSEELFFNIGGAEDESLPIVEKLEYEGKELSTIKQTSGVKTGGQLTATISNPEKDDLTVNLIDRLAGEKVQSANVNDNYIESIVQSVVNKVFGFFYEDQQLTQGGDTVEIPFKITDETDLLTILNDNSEIGLEVVDQNDGTRRTVNYPVFTDQANSAPSINGIYANSDCGSNWDPISSFDSDTKNLECAAVEASDPDGDGLFVNLQLENQYDNIIYYRTQSDYGGSSQKQGDYYIFNLSSTGLGKINESGTWTANATADDGLSTDDYSTSWQVPWGDLNVEMTQPDTDFSVLNNESFDFNLKLTCSGGPECVNQNETVNVYWDPVKASFQNLKTWSSGFL